MAWRAGVRRSFSILIATASASASADFVAQPPVTDLAVVRAEYRPELIAPADRFTIESTISGTFDAAQNPGNAATRAAAWVEIAANQATASIPIPSSGSFSVVRLPDPPPGNRGSSRDIGSIGDFGNVRPISFDSGIVHPQIPDFPMTTTPAPDSALLGLLGLAVAAHIRRRA